MRNRLVVLAVLLWLAPALVAQDVEEQIAAASARFERGEHAAAIAALVRLQERTATAPQRERLRAELQRMAAARRLEFDFPPALQAFEAALAIAKQLHPGDHADVAAALCGVGLCLHYLGRADQALPISEAALAMRQRLSPEQDSELIAESLNNVGHCLEALSRPVEALQRFEQLLAMVQRNVGDADAPLAAHALACIAKGRAALGQWQEALAYNEQALAMERRLCSGSDDPRVAAACNNVATCLQTLGRLDEALRRYEEALAIRRRLFGDRDHRLTAELLDNLGNCLVDLGRPAEARTHYEAALGMHARLLGARDHPEIARCLRGLAECHLALGEPARALPGFETAQAMTRRLHGERDHEHVAEGVRAVGACLVALGRLEEARAQFATALAIEQRLHAGRDHPDVANAYEWLGRAIMGLDRPGDALGPLEAALAIQRRVLGERDHTDIASLHTQLGACLRALGRPAEALQHQETALAMIRRLHADRDHPHVATSLHNVGVGLVHLDRPDEAITLLTEAMAMDRRLYGDRDHPQVAIGLGEIAGCLQRLGRLDEAKAHCEHAVAMIERLRDASPLSLDLRQSLFDELKRARAFDRLQGLSVQLGQTSDALLAMERARARGLLDLLEQQPSDPIAVAEQRAADGGDKAAVARLRASREQIAAARLHCDELLQRLTRLGDPGDGADRAGLVVRAEQASQRLRQLLDERARLLADVMPVGRVRTATEIRSILHQGELLLGFTLTPDLAVLYVVAPDGEVAVHRLPTAYATAERVLPMLLAHAARRAPEAQRGRDPEAATNAGDPVAGAHELFTALVPPAVWERIRTGTRVFVAAHRGLHRLPFELLVTEVRDGRAVRWLENGPPVAYVPSGSALHWLRTRSHEGATAGLDFVAVGDPAIVAAEPELPEQGALVVQVVRGSQAERLGLQVRDVLVRYDGQPIADQPALGALRQALDQALAAGTRQPGPIPLEVWRAGELLRLQLQPGAIGVQLALSPPRLAYEGTLPGDEQLARIARAGDLDRIRQLPRLQGAAAEATAIAAAFRERDGRVELRLGADATEPVVFDLAAKAKYLHFACHGVAEEYAGQSLSMLVLSPPPQVLPGDDGLLKLGDLLHAWRGRLSSTRLVVLSACRTNVGPTLRDEAPQALPLGFLFAGAPAVISSLWAVDDASTKELMTDFYQRLLAGEQDQLAAFTAAKRALAGRHPDPFHWAPFLYVGSPD